MTRVPQAARSRVPLSTLLAAAALAGCSSGSPSTALPPADPTPSASATPSPAPTSTAPAATSAPDSVSSSAPVGLASSSSPSQPVPSSAAPPALATVAGASPASRGVTITITSLHRDSATEVTLLSTITNMGASAFALSNLSASAYIKGGGYEFPSASGVTMVDAAHSLRYYPLHDVQSHCLCTVFMLGDSVKPGDSVPVSTTFPAPPAGVTAMSVAWGGFAPAGDVPLS